MKKNIVFKIALIMLMMVIIATNISVCFAEEEEGNFNFGAFDNKEADSSLTTPVKQATGTILNAIRIVGTGVSLIILAVVGMKYMMAAPGERADYKKTAIQYVVGAVIVFGASNILDILVSAFDAVMKLE